MLDPSHTTTDNIASCMSSFRESEESDSETEPGLSNLFPQLEQLRSLMEQLQTAMTEVVGEERMQQMREAARQAMEEGGLSLPSEGLFGGLRGLGLCITPLHQACVAGNLNEVKALVLDEHCDVNAQDNDGNTPLILAAHLGKTDIVLACF